MKAYLTDRNRHGTRVFVFLDALRFRELSPADSQEVYNHSPDGFEWGYGGSGPAQLALAILLDLYAKEEALRAYQEFKWKFVAKAPKEGFRFLEEDIRQFVDAQLSLGGGR